MAKYNMPFNQYKACMKMSKNEFSRWVDAFAGAMWEQGYIKAMENINKPEPTEETNSVTIDTTDTMLIDTSEEQIREILLSVPGVGPKLCEKIIDRVYEVCDGYISE